MSRILPTPKALVAVLCGPHLSSDFFSPRPHRLDGGIALARTREFSMLYVGDGWARRDIAHAVARAESAGVNVRGAYYRDVLRLDRDPTNGRGRTLYDAQTILVLLASDPSLAEVEELHVTTDWWHMERTLTFLRGEMAKFLPAGRTVRFVPNIVEGHDPAPEQLLGEQKGIADYLAGHSYAPVRGAWEGKREHVSEGTLY